MMACSTSCYRTARASSSTARPSEVFPRISSNRAVRTYSSQPRVMTDTVVDLDAGEYRRNVGICVVNSHGAVFAAKRLDDDKNTWQMPQGGIDPGEVPQDAALRELWEETSIRSVKVLKELDTWLVYDFPPEVRQKQTGSFRAFRGQAQRWFLFQFLGDDSEVNLETEHKEFSEWQWMPLEDLPELVIPFKRAVYEEVARSFTPIISQQLLSKS